MEIQAPSINPFDQIAAAIQELDQRLKAVEQKTQHDENKPKRILLRKFCHEHQISRPTAYNWASRGLIKMERVGRLMYVLADSITVEAKYQRKPLE
jgi:hypothetical protein